MEQLRPPAAVLLTAEITLRFRLPPPLVLGVAPGRWQPCIHQARVDVGEDYDVEIRAFNGSEREARRIVFEQAKRFLVAIAGGERKLPMASFSGRLYNNRRAENRISGGERYEHYEFVTGASISITQAFMKPAVVA